MSENVVIRQVPNELHQLEVVFPLAAAANDKLFGATDGVIDANTTLKIFVNDTDPTTTGSSAHLKVDLKSIMDAFTATVPANQSANVVRVILLAASCRTSAHNAAAVLTS